MLGVIYYCGLIMSTFCFGKSMAVSDEMREMAQMLHDSCVESIGVDEGLITKANAGEIIEDNKLKCYMKCLMDEVSAIAFKPRVRLLDNLADIIEWRRGRMKKITDDGMIDEDVLISMLPEEMADEAASIIRSCGTVKGADDCDTIFQTQKCYFDKSPAKYFLI